ncbi:aldehyde dehydrogenase family protein [Achromobacter sp. NFACC18-2]|uniref:aldehyde dehydrogenase family protein n=1 Tax=Achromobacter sp. NFACC18-2 TaxID=1564112 RepID=UPI000B84ADFB|nr:aldehyde dehydrogenase family protein [Achromobacter sp. NFACC18-2]
MVHAGAWPTAVTLTGSTAVGKRVALQAGSLLKRQVLKLGGSDLFIVPADADIATKATRVCPPTEYSK